MIKHIFIIKMIMEYLNSKLEKQEMKIKDKKYTIMMDILKL